MPKLEELYRNDNRIGDDAVALAEVVGKGALPKLARPPHRRQQAFAQGQQENRE